MGSGTRPLPPQFIAFVAGFGLALAGVMVLGFPSSGLGAVRAKRRDDFVLLVRLDFADPADVTRFVELAKDEIEHVRRREPETLSYEIGIADNDPTKVVFIERYTDKDTAYLEVHKQSAAFLTFRHKLREMQEDGLVTITGQSYLTSGLGFV